MLKKIRMFLCNKLDIHKPTANIRNDRDSKKSYCKYCKNKILKDRYKDQKWTSY